MAQLDLAVPAANGQGAAQTWRGGWGTVWCSGTFNSGTVTLQVSYDAGSSYQTAKDDAGNNVAFTAAGHMQIAYAGTPLLRASLSGSGGATDVDLLCVYGLAHTRQGAQGIDVA
jgi:hypothetical protein